MSANLIVASPQGPNAAARPADGLLRRFLSAYWLRPENALWMTLRSAALAEAPWTPPVLDAACGDGVFTFLHLGGAFDDAFDVYYGADAERTRVGATGDIYDHCALRYQPAICVRPQQSVDVGCDHKNALLAKARRLDLYQSLERLDLNAPLPFSDRRFETIYCNAAYWVRNVEGLLSEFRRVLRPGGQLILQVKLDAMRRHTAASFGADLGPAVRALLDGDRLTCWPTLADRDTWERRFARCALDIRDARPFVTAAHAALWNIGLRPLAPLLMRMVDALNPQTRLAIKKDWVNLFLDLLKPMNRFVFSTPARGEPVEMQFVLTR